MDHLLEDGALTLSSANLMRSFSASIANVDTLRLHEGCQLSTICESSINGEELWRSKQGEPVITEDLSTLQRRGIPASVGHDPSSMKQSSHADDGEDSEAIAQGITTFKAVSCDLIVEGVKTRRLDHRCRLRLLQVLTGLTPEMLQANFSIRAIAEELACPVI